MSVAADRTLHADEHRVCRVCNATDRVGDMVYYAIRCYAHPACLFKARGEQAIASLHAWQIRGLPVLLMKRAGLTPERLAVLLRERELEEEKRDASFHAIRLDAAREQFYEAAARLVEECENHRDVEAEAGAAWFEAVAEAREKLDAVVAARRYTGTRVSS
jgi:hypothetical protein